MPAVRLAVLRAEVPVLCLWRESCIALTAVADQRIDPRGRRLSTIRESSVRYPQHLVGEGIEHKNCMIRRELEESNMA